MAKYFNVTQDKEGVLVIHSSYTGQQLKIIYQDKNEWKGEENEPLAIKYSPKKQQYLINTEYIVGLNEVGKDYYAKTILSVIGNFFRDAVSDKLDMYEVLVPNLHTARTIKNSIEGGYTEGIEPSKYKVIPLTTAKDKKRLQP